jgi:hypothetical protein
MFAPQYGIHIHPRNKNISLRRDHRGHLQFPDFRGEPDPGLLEQQSRHH